MSQATEPVERWTDDRGWSHRVREVNGVDLHYAVAGPEDAPPVVLLHGFPESWWAWHRHVDPLAESFRVVVPDMRGYARSGKPEGLEHYRLEALVNDVAGLVDAEGHDAAHLVGHDWGGVVALSTALRRPERVRRLAMLNAPHPEAVLEQFTLRQALRSWYVGFLQVPAVPERLLSAQDFALLERLFRETPERDDAYTDADVRRYKRGWRREGSLRAMVDYYRAFAREQTPLLWRGREQRPVPAETLVLWGRRDRALGSHIPEVLRRELDATVRYYPEASHWLHAEYPAETAADLRTFLSR